MLETLKDIHSWYDFRKKRFWLLVLLALYTFTGFVIVPWVLQKQVPLLGQEYLQRGVTIESASFNPWTLRLQANNFQLSDENDVSMFTFDSLVINVQTSSIFNWALTFDEISLTGPKVNLVRYAFADSNFGRMLNDIEANALPTDETEVQAEDSGNLRLKVATLAINNGVIDLADEMPSTPFNTRIEPINIGVTDLSTLPGESGAQQINLTTQNGAELSWSGSLQLNPLVSEGRIEISGSPLPTIYRYFESQLDFTLDNCCFEIALDYEAISQTDGEVAVNISNLDALLSKVRINQRGTDEPVFSLPAMRINGGSLAWPEQTVNINEFVLEQPELYIWANTDGSLNLDKLLLADAETETIETELSDTSTSSQVAQEGESTATPQESPWDVSLGEFRIDGMKLAYSDRTLPKPGNIQLNPINLSLQNISTTPENKSPLTIDIAIASGGQIGMVGEMTLLPDVTLNTTLAVDDFALPVIQPWAEDSAKVLIQQGTFSLAGDIYSSPAETLGLNADLAITDLKISDTVKDETLLGWKNLSIKQARMKLDAGDLEISSVELLEPFARVIIATDGSTNFQSLTQDDTTESTAEPEVIIADEASTTMNVRVGQTLIDNASVDFSDASLPLPFRVLINEFGGSMSAIDNQSRQPSLLNFEGRVGEYGLTTLSGPVNIMAPTDEADIQFDFRNVNMVDLSPYTADFVGRKISSGKLNLDLNYKFENQKIIGENNIVLSDFTLGEQVESEDAMSLPLDLAIALLKDVNGTIDLDVKISGDMDDPDFSASGIILKAFANIIIKAAASPFKLLGGLIPGGNKTDFENIEFLPGRADLTPPEREKITQLSAALLQRPTLSLQIDGGYSRAADMQALQKINVDNQLASIMGTADSETGEALMLTRKYRKALEKLAKKQLEGISLRALRAEFDRPDPQTGDKSFDELAYTMELRARLEAAQPVDNNYLETLATQRSEMVIALLTSLGELDTTRIIAGTVVEVEANKDGWIAMPMNIVINDSPPEKILESPSTTVLPQSAS